jgi:hypothetical protein
MAQSQAQEEDGSSENEPLNTGEFEKPELLSSSVEGDDEKFLHFWINKRANCFSFVIVSSI